MNEKLQINLFVAFCLTAAALGLACSAIPPTDTGGPQPTQPTYPILLHEDPERREATLNAAARAIAGSTSATNITLQPVTATIASLPPNQPLPFYLPKLGTGAVMNEGETRESLRRFLIDWQNIMGADPAHLSLISRDSAPNGAQVATYEQRPFRHPLRGGFGNLKIQFGNDRRILNITSTCIPEAESLQAMLAAITPSLTPEDAAQYILQNGVTFTDPTGRTLTLNPTEEQVEVREPVFFVKGSQEALEFRLAWAVELTDAAVKIVYLDAVRAEVLGVE